MAADAESDEDERAPDADDAEIAVVDIERGILVSIGLDNRDGDVVKSSLGSVAADSPVDRTMPPLPLPVGNGLLTSLSSDPWSVLSSSSFGPWPAPESTVPTWREEGSEKRVGRHDRCG